MGGDTFHEWLSDPSNLKWLCNHTRKRFPGQEACDLVQQAILQVIETKSRGGQVLHARAYLLRTIANIAAAGPRQNIMFPPSSFGTEPFGDVDFKFKRAAVESIMDSVLTKAQHSLIKLILEYGLSVKDAAGALGLSYPAARMTYMRAVHTLRKALSAPAP